MRASRIVGMALGIGLGVAAVPFFLPAGPDAGINASGLLESGRFLVAGGLIFLGGLLTSLTPCVYPLIPITVSVFGARKAATKGQAVLLTSAYVVGMGLVFSALGVAAALSGKAFGSSLGNPWVAAGLAVFLFLLSLSMFGAYELALPPSLANRLSGVGGAGVAGALLMGSVSGFLAAPCTGPVLTGVLAFVAKSQSVVLGAGLLFVYAMGIGVPFFLIGVFTVRLPRGGEWMEWVKSLFGIALVALAAAYLRDAFAPARTAFSALASELGRIPGAWVAGTLAAVGVAFGAIHLSFKEGSSPFIRKAVGVTLVVAAILLRIGATNASPVGALWVRAGWVAPATHEGVRWHLELPGAEGTDPLEAALTNAKAQGKPVMIDFFADWCEACKELDREVYIAPEVIGESARFINIKVDGTAGDDAIEKLYARFGIQGLPTVAFLDSRGQLLGEPRVTGFLAAEKFVDVQRAVR